MAESNFNKRPHVLQKESRTSKGTQVCACGIRTNHPECCIVCSIKWRVDLQMRAERKAEAFMRDFYHEQLNRAEGVVVV